MLAVGRLGDMWGHRNVYLLGMAIFVVASGVCGLASSTQFLVAGRAIQAIGASMIFAKACRSPAESFEVSTCNCVGAKRTVILSSSARSGAGVLPFLALDFAVAGVLTSATIIMRTKYPHNLIRSHLDC